jgi:hypothetical protein
MTYPHVVATYPPINHDICATGQNSPDFCPPPTPDHDLANAAGCARADDTATVFLFFRLHVAAWGIGFLLASFSSFFVPGSFFLLSLS